ncbi:hypothetical protein COY26_02720 [Candidatus Woesearchaeota archaeon CG_4_10_14_0_2_um_filter_33_10]|nr:MAG: hypothetical protein AUJ83_02815 [Candidatus Woesearchaeota archaeon CG1_02_33_12]PIN77541.1 MAG: hypothetical protein COV14_05655 [Candidatus Woesearchaeota archaeon CG10_big_fil_rev_8_21_14_0_10_33_12]PIU72215.1 MAG: hypothetical protein COS79_04070 [Candidatus Woesearchaeota archaeon CG06_land_8_20_14_3_00_33_13]PIZ53167.1 MAG: hypothetical protein COY26_02720 [Candidatus Woesearchaeota archaeon CG_4_10_14_0_2_um_filter_33_10]
MAKTKSSGPSPVRTIFLLFIVFFAILYFVFQPDDFSLVLIPFIISLSLAYFFGMWLVSQEV